MPTDGPRDDGGRRDGRRHRVSQHEGRRSKWASSVAPVAFVPHSVIHSVVHSVDIPWTFRGHSADIPCHSAVIVLAAALLSGSLAAQRAASGTAVIRGRVIARDTGLPLRAASVQVISEETILTGSAPRR